MADNTLRDRVLQSAKAFDGLLSLIPAKLYYGGDTSDQWKKKKQTKAEAAAAKRAKLDPESAKTARDVMDERARKRKLEEMEDSDINGVEKEVPKQGMKDNSQKNKKVKPETASTETVDSTSKVDTLDAVDPEIAIAAKKARIQAKKEKLKEKKEKVAKKAEAKKAKRQAAADNTVVLGEDEDAADDVQPKADVDPEILAEEDEMAEIELDGIADDAKSSDSSPTSPDASPIFDTLAEPTTSTSSSTSSDIPPESKKHTLIQADALTKPEIRAKVEARIAALRAARKADSRTRQELQDFRRNKAEKRKVLVKALRSKAREEEDARREAALVAARDSPASGIMSPSIHTAGSDNNFSFGRVAFSDGQQLTDDLSGLLSAPKRKGPQDAATALLASEKKRQRIAGFDDAKRADIEEKDLWLAARKRAHGEKVRDDASLLKKTLKRKEVAKKKSAKEWNERKEGIAKSQAMRQKKRTDNLQKRKDERGSKVKGKKSGGAKKGGKPKSRPGFEGSFSSGGKRK